jgi:hypothetical protein
VIPQPLENPNDQTQQFTAENPAREMVRPPESADKADAASRPEIPKPEALAAAHEAVLPQPLPTPKIPPQQVATPTAQNDNLVIDEETLKGAEQKLAEYIGTRISPALTDGLVLTLLEDPAHGKAGIKLCLQGSKVSTNSALLGEQVLAALQSHEVFAPLAAHKETAPHVAKPHEADKQDMVHVHVGNLTTTQYAELLHNLAGTEKVKPTPTTAAVEETASLVPPATEQLPTLDVVAPAAANDAALGLVKETPSTNVQTPVAALERVAEAPHRAVG